MNTERIEGKNYWKDGFTSCPDCGSMVFLKGPRGGLCQNFKCQDCGSEFNNMGPFGIERLSGPPNHGRRIIKEVKL